MVLGLSVFIYIRRPNLTPAAHGYQLAEKNGCFSCHGAGGTGGVQNPGSDEGVIPAWDGGNAMMYVQNEQEIREWILDGHPKRLKGQHKHGHQDESADNHSHLNDETARTNQTTLPIRMPAFEGAFSESNLRDLVAYYKAVAVFETTPPEVKKGYNIASQLGCFGCHGPGGRVGSKNPRSFKGYIPPWQGKDYALLVKNKKERRQWILEGNIDRFRSNPLARFFVNRQIIKMPVYGDLIDEKKYESLVTYIDWLQKVDSK